VSKRPPPPCDTCPCAGWGLECEGVAEKKPEPDKAPPPFDRWYVEIKDGSEWMPAGARHADRPTALQRLKAARTQRPQWADGTPVQYRLVRETTAYTVDPA
jgi:hypothetical protein